MKKVLTKILFAVLVISMAISTMLFCACSSNPQLQNVSVNIKAEYADTNGEYRIGSFPYDHYEVVSTFSDGTTTVRDLTIEDIDEIEGLKLWNTDSHVIELNIQGFTCSFTCVGKRNVFGDVSLKNINAVYNGSNFELEIEGRLPEGTKIEYPNGRYFKNVGHWDVKVSLSCDNYVEKVLTGTVDIIPATYDMSGFVFEDYSVPYDGSQHSLKGSGTLPNGVTVSYYIGKIENGKTLGLSAGNSATEIGKYYVEARFNYSDANYNRIDSIIRYLEITKIKFDLNGIENDLIRQSHEMIFFDGEDHRLDVSPLAVISDKIEYDKIVRKYYRINEDGTYVQVMNNELISEVGEYAVELSNFVVKEQFKSKYEVAKEKIVVPYTISPQLFDYSVFLENKMVVYNGMPQEMYFDTGYIPAMSSMNFIGYKYILDGVEVEKPVDAGEYSVSLLFTEDKNFYVKPVSAKLTIKPYEFQPLTEAVYGEYTENGITASVLEGLIFNEYQKFISDSVDFGFSMSNGDDFTKLTQSGTYQVVAHVYPKNDNVSVTEETENFNVTFVIKKAQLPQSIMNQLINTLKISYGDNLPNAIAQKVADVKDECGEITFTPILKKGSTTLDYDKVLSGELILSGGNYLFYLNDFESDNFYAESIVFSIEIARVLLPNNILNVLYLDNIELYYGENVLNIFYPMIDKIAQRELGYAENQFLTEFTFEFRLIDIENQCLRKLSDLLESGEYDLCIDSIISDNYYYEQTLTYDLTVKPLQEMPTELKALFNKSFSAKTTDNVNEIISNYVNEIKSAHSDFEFTGTLYKNSVEFKASDVIIYSKNSVVYNFYPEGEYTYKFTNFKCRNYGEQSNIGELTIYVSKVDIPNDLKSEAFGKLKAGNSLTFSDSFNSTEIKKAQFFIEACDIYTTFMSDYGKLFNIGKFTCTIDNREYNLLDTEQATEAYMTIRVSYSSATICFGDITSSVYKGFSTQALWSLICQM